MVAAPVVELNTITSDLTCIHALSTFTAVKVDRDDFFVELSVLCPQDFFCQIKHVRGSLWGDVFDLTEKVLFT